MSENLLNATVGLYTLGCKVSQYETEAIAESFQRCGFTLSDFSSVCDFYVINTCTVTAESDRKSRQMIRRAARLNPSAKIMVCGCYSQRSPGEVFEMPEVSCVIGSGGKMQLANIARDMLLGKIKEKYISVTDINSQPFEPMCITRAPRTRAYVKIEDGCEARCTYCAIPSARGAVRSKPPADVIAEVEALYRGGTREVVLTGIETGSYGADFSEKYTLADLLSELDRRGSAERIRLGSLAPELIGERFASGIRGLKSLAPHFHISIQSGSDNVLRLMKRRYSRAMALENINRLREYTGAMFTTDLMVGFPGESEEDFQDTLRFVSEAEFLDAHVFAYSKRHSTPAADYPMQIPEAVKRRRSEELIRHVREVRQRVLSRVLREGRVLSVVFETECNGVWSGHSAEFIEVEYRNNDKISLHGEIKSCKPIAVENDKIIVEIL